VLSIKTDILSAIYKSHYATINHGFQSIDLGKIEEAADIIAAAVSRSSNIFTIGNGASAAIAQHWACDYTKGCAKGRFEPRVISLSTNIPLMTAIGNDISFDEVYAYQLDKLALDGDIVIAISSSGNSPNIVKALELARKHDLYTIALTGFDGGKARELADTSIHVDIPEYEAAEDVHQAIMHILAKYLRARFWG
jgi:phosphoheptose isomerase